VEYSRSATAYASLVKRQPELLLAASPARVQRMLHVLRQLLPPGFQPEDVLRSRPQLLLAWPRQLARKWEELREVCSQVRACAWVNAGAFGGGKN
jgi:hypothetical protein